jgi:hypothetical protein
MSTEFISFHDTRNSSFRMDLSKVSWTCAEWLDGIPCISFSYTDLNFLECCLEDHEIKQLRYGSTDLRDEDLSIFNFLIGTYGS